MQKLLFKAVIFVVTSVNSDDEELIDLENKQGNAYNFNNGGSVSYADKALGLELSEENIPGGVSYCVVLLLWDEE